MTRKPASVPARRAPGCRDVARAEALHRVQPQPRDVMRADPERRHEALDLGRPLDLPPDPVPETVRREHDERQEAGRDDREARAESFEHAATAVSPPQHDERDRQEDRRVELHDDPRSDHGAGESLAAGEQQRDGEDGDERREVVEARQRDRSEQDRPRADEEERRVHPCARRAEHPQRPRGGDDGQEPDDEQLDAEPVVVRLVVAGELAQVDRRDEDRDRAGRILEREVPVRQVVRRGQRAPVLVEVDVAEQPVPVVGHVRHHVPDDDEDGGCGELRAEKPCAVSPRGRAPVDSAAAAATRHRRSGRRRA